MKKIIFTLAAIVAAVNLSAQSTTPASKTGKCGETVTIKATPDAGYKFVQWQDGVTENPRAIEITSALSVLDYVATFAPATMTVVATANDASMGSVSGAGEGAFGSEMTLSATPKDGCYRFKQWSDGNTENPRTITVAATAEANTYQAIFEEVPFVITVTAGANGSVSVE